MYLDRTGQTSKLAHMKTLEIGAFEAKNRLSVLLADAERGQRIYITRRGKRVALLSPANEESARNKPADLLARITAFRKNARPGTESLKQLIEEGRR